MDALRQYIISVVAAAMICGIITGLFQKGTAREIIKLVCGLFLAYTVLAPVTRLDFNQLTTLPFSGATDAAEAAAVGESLSKEALAERIKEETQAYILDKASKLGAVLDVEVALDDDNIPVSVTLRGEVSPYERRKLQSTIALDLGIAKENQQWTG